MPKTNAEDREYVVVSEPAGRVGAGMQSVESVSMFGTYTLLQ